MMQKQCFVISKFSSARVHITRKENWRIKLIWFPYVVYELLLENIFVLRLTANTIVLPNHLGGGWWSRFILNLGFLAP